MTAAPVPERDAERAAVAMLHSAWTEAEALWASAIASQGAGANPEWFAMRAWSLGYAGRFGEALESFDAALARLGDAAHPADWLAGRAWALDSLGRQAEAVPERDRAIESAGASVNPEWFAMQAWSLGHLARFGEALARFDAALARAGETAPPEWIAGRAWVLDALERPAEALLDWQRAIERAGPAARVDWTDAKLCALYAVSIREAEEFLATHSRGDSRDRTELIARLTIFRRRRMPEARAAFAALLAQCDEPRILEILTDSVAPIFEGVERTRALEALVREASRLGAAGDGDGLVEVQRLRLLFALRDYDGFARAFAAADPARLGKEADKLRRVATALRRPAFPDATEPKLFGIGLAKTGTTSLAAALEALGFATLHYVNPLTNDLIGADDYYFFDAFADTPVCVDFERLFYTFEGSKFIYTVRDPRAWERSITAHMERHLDVHGHADLARKLRLRDQFWYGRRFAEIDSSLFGNHADLRSAFDTYDKRVRRFFEDKPAERFLEIDVSSGDGWGRLCRFLGVDVPAVPFPRLNSAPARARTSPASGEETR